IQDEDVLIGISFPRYSSNTVQAFQYAYRNNAKTIAITDSFSSPLMKYADSVLLAQSDMISFIDGLVAPLSLVNALIIAVGLKKKAKISEIFQKLEYIWEEYRVYENFKVKRKSND
ncbi:MAG: SIS domain-containing protein, partial [Oscillospiraceae bacterium]|nr:SIS domain-containing protein [Oscillospiraceae bacterium]